MGPRRGCRGRPFLWIVSTEPRCVLQWGRDEGVAEDTRSPGATGEGSELQWGRDEGVAEDSAWCRNSPAQDTSLQWGRDEGVAEDPTTA